MLDVSAHTLFESGSVHDGRRVLVHLRRWRLMLLAGLVAVLAGCASPRLATTVTRFHQWPANIQGASFAIVPAGEQASVRLAPAEQQLDSGPAGAQLMLPVLEHQAYAAHMAHALQAKGLVPAVHADRARLVASMTVHAQQGVVHERELVMRPVLWMGYRGFYWRTGPIFYSRWGDDYYDDDLWGGWSERIVRRPVQSYSLHVKVIDQGQAGKRSVGQKSPTSSGASAPIVLDARAQYIGRPAPLATVMPYLIRAVFEDFPGVSGQTRQVVFDTETG